MPLLSRRRFLLLTATASAAACTGGASESGTPATDDTGAQLPLLQPSKAPWVQPLSPTTARLRFETRQARALPVTLIGPDRGSTTVSPTLQEDELAYSWGAELDNVLPDEAGLHVLQEVVFEDLVPGETYAWQVDLGGGEVLTGSFRAPVAPGTGFRLGWMADSMAPIATDTAAVLAAALPDLAVHGGDLVYQSSPADTWAGLSVALEGLHQEAAFLVLPGNHEYEDMDEIHVMFDRLFMPQLDQGGPRYGRLDISGVCLLLLDSESERHDLPQDVEGQWDWVATELAAAAADPDIVAIVVGMHRPMFTGSKYWVEDPTTRDQRHALFVEHGVDLVLCGHAHCYEHWAVDGVHYVVDGGAGALTYDPDEGMDQLTKARPDEAKLRVVAIRSYGVTVVDVGADGSMQVQRLSSDQGTVEDSFTIPA